MRVRTYTNMWNEERKLYTIYEWTLPTPVSFKQIALFVVGAIIWMPIMFVLNVPIGTSWGFVLWFAFPVALAIFGNKQFIEHKSIIQYLQSVLGYILFEPKYILDGKGVNLREEKMASPDKPSQLEKHVIEYKVWTKDKLEKI